MTFAVSPPTTSFSHDHSPASDQLLLLRVATAVAKMQSTSTMVLTTDTGKHALNFVPVALSWDVETVTAEVSGQCAPERWR